MEKVKGKDGGREKICQRKSRREQKRGGVGGREWRGQREGVSRRERRDKYTYKLKNLPTPITLPTPLSPSSSLYLICLSKNVPPLRVTQDHPLHTHITNHLWTERECVCEEED